jgi:hypothetical protein
MGGNDYTFSERQKSFLERHPPIKVGDSAAVVAKKLRTNLGQAKLTSVLDILRPLHNGSPTELEQKVKTLETELRALKSAPPEGSQKKIVDQDAAVVPEWDEDGFPKKPSHELMQRLLECDDWGFVTDILRQIEETDLCDGKWHSHEEHCARIDAPPIEIQFALKIASVAQDTGIVALDEKTHAHIVEEVLQAQSEIKEAREEDVQAALDELVNQGAFESREVDGRVEYRSTGTSEDATAKYCSHCGAPGAAELIDGSFICNECAEDGELPRMFRDLPPASAAKEASEIDAIKAELQQVLIAYVESKGAPNPKIGDLLFQARKLIHAEAGLKPTAKSKVPAWEKKRRKLWDTWTLELEHLPNGYAVLLGARRADIFIANRSK